MTTAFYLSYPKIYSSAYKLFFRKKQAISICICETIILQMRTVIKRHLWSFALACQNRNQFHEHYKSTKLFKITAGPGDLLRPLQKEKFREWKNVFVHPEGFILCLQNQASIAGKYYFLGCSHQHLAQSLEDLSLKDRLSLLLLCKYFLHVLSWKNRFSPVIKSASLFFSLSQRDLAGVCSTVWWSGNLSVVDKIYKMFNLHLLYLVRYCTRKNIPSWKRRIKTFLN